MVSVLIAIRYCLGLLAGGLWITRAQLVPVPIPGMSIPGRVGAPHRACPSLGWMIVRPELGTFGTQPDRWLSVLARASGGGKQSRWPLRRSEPLLSEPFRSRI